MRSRQVCHCVAVQDGDERSSDVATAQDADAQRSRRAGFIGRGERQGSRQRRRARPKRYRQRTCAPARISADSPEARADLNRLIVDLGRPQPADFDVK